jgi:hypothetical protein
MRVLGMHVPTLLAGVAMFVAVGLALHYVAGIAVWASIAIPGFILGAVRGLGERSGA